MDRRMERIFIGAGAIWNIVNGLITMLFYSTWVRSSVFKGMNGSTKGLNLLSENLHTVTIIYGLFYILIGILNLYISIYRINTDLVANRLVVWILVLCCISYFLVDPLSLIAYLVAGMLLIFKNHAVKAKIKAR